MGGTCVAVCEAGFGDCNPDVTDGCETDLASTAGSCGACGSVCPLGASCTGTGCECPQGQLGCGATCTNPLVDEANCGQCGQACPPVATCVAGACVCPPGKVDCGSTCADLESDTHNCKVCGRDCQGGVCHYGLCDPVALYSGQTAPISLGLDEDYVYWASQKGLRRGPRLGGAAEQIVELTAIPDLPLVFTDTHVYFMQERGDASNVYIGEDLARAEKSSSSVVGKVMASGKGFVTAFASDGIWFYWGSHTTDKNDSSIYRWSVGSSTPELLVSGVAEPVSLQYHDGYIYWANKGGGSLMRLASTGGVPEVLASGQELPCSLVLDDTILFWVTGGWSTARVWTMPMVGGAMTKLVGPIQSADLGALAVDDTRLFYVWASVTGAVDQKPKAGGTAIGRAANQGYIRQMLTDSCCIYWTDQYEGNVMKAVK